MLEMQKELMKRINTMLENGKLLSSVLFDTTEVMTILYEDHIWFARIMDGMAYDLCDLQNEKHIKPVVDYTDGKLRMHIHRVKRLSRQLKKSRGLKHRP